MADSTHWQCVWANFWLQRIHNNFNVRNKIIEKICSPLNFYLLTWDKFAPPYTSPYLAHNPLRDKG